MMFLVEVLYVVMKQVRTSRLYLNFSGRCMVLIKLLNANT